MAGEAPTMNISDEASASKISMSQLSIRNTTNADRSPRNRELVLTSTACIKDAEMQFDVGNSECGPSHRSRVDRIQRMIQERNDFASEIEFKRAFSKDHWTELDLSCSKSQCLLKVTKENVVDTIAALRKKWIGGTFFGNGNSGITIGQKIGEGGQAEIYEAKWGDEDTPFALKVFKADSVGSLQSQWPAQLFKLSGLSVGLCDIYQGLFLEDKRFAFLMPLFQGDFRSVIDAIMVEKNNQGPPLSESNAVYHMIYIARSMEYLHSNGILHRDLKASNVLIGATSDAVPTTWKDTSLFCCLADYECSVGVIGTGFWRAPEVSQALKELNLQLTSRSEVYGYELTTKGDVYSYAMTCYEILTGRIPFEDHPRSNYDIVIRGERLKLPNGLDLALTNLFE